MILKQIAQKEDISFSEAIRRIIEGAIEKTKPKTKRQNVGNWLLSLEKEARRLKVRGPKDLASKIDYYLYGANKDAV